MNAAALLVVQLIVGEALKPQIVDMQIWAKLHKGFFCGKNTARRSCLVHDFALL